MKVLIIDDDEAMIGIWSTVLKKDDIEVITAGSGKLGIELATKNIPDFILLDQIITDMKGNDVLKQLKSNPATVNIPVALVSNYSEPEMMHEAIESGATDYILKYQIDPSDLANKIKTLLHGTKSLNPGLGQGEAGQAPGQPVVAPMPADPQSQISDPAAQVQPQLVANQPFAGAVQPQMPPVADPSQAVNPVQPVQPATAAAPADPAQVVMIDPTKPTQ